MTKSEFLKLSEKYLAGKATPAEQELLREYRDRIELLDNVWEPDMGDKEQIYRDLSSSIFPERDREKGEVKRLRVFLKAVAALLVAVSVSIVLWKVSQEGQSKEQGELGVAGANLPPADEKAYLTLADGRRIALDARELDITIQEGVSVGRNREGKLVYTFDDSSEGIREDQYNIISTPQGGHYSVVLPDSTRVWLNAASSLKFPLRFNANQRVVEITGEAFFDVRKDNGRSFIVKTGRSEITVLGTQFNVSAYPDNDETSTTLVEGSVLMKAGNEEVRLTPGTRATADGGKAISVQRVGRLEAVAWRNGLFAFHNESIVEIMKELSRWYDVEIVFQGAATKEKEFSGSISRFKEITDVLEMMKLAGGVNYKVEGRRITIMD